MTLVAFCRSHSSALRREPHHHNPSAPTFSQTRASPPQQPLAAPSSKHQAHGRYAGKCLRHLRRVPFLAAILGLFPARFNYNKNLRRVEWNAECHYPWAAGSVAPSNVRLAVSILEIHDGAVPSSKHQAHGRYAGKCLRHLCRVPFCSAYAGSFFRRTSTTTNI